MSRGRRRPGRQTGAGGERTRRRLGAEFSIPPGFTLILNHEPSLWLRSAVRSVGEQWAKHATACPHAVSSVDVATAVWAPDRIACPACAGDLLAAHGVEDRTCDRCRAVVAPIYPMAAVTPTLAGLFGPVRVTIMYGLCGACKQREVPA